MKSRLCRSIRITHWMGVMGIVAGFTLIISVAPYIERLVIGTGFEWFGLQFRRMFVNYHDMRVYYRLGVWARSTLLPYHDYIAEYPPLSMLIFAVPHVLTRIFGLASTFSNYRIFYTMMSGAILFFVVWFISRIRYQLQRGGFLRQDGHDTVAINSDRSDCMHCLFLLCIASVYFTYNRFDLFPSIFLLASVYLFVRGKISASMICWACAFALKWYAAVVVPIYAAYLWQQGEYRHWWRGCALAATTLILIHLPVFLYGGIESILSPYLFHVDRLGNRESVFHLIRLILPFGEGRVLGRIFLAIQLLFPFSAFFVRKLSVQSVVYGVIAAIAVFIFFAVFQSPQWVLWLSPLLLSFARNKRALLLLFLLEVVTYCYFPIFFGYQSRNIELSRVLTFVLIPQFIIMGSIIVYTTQNALLLRTTAVSTQERGEGAR